MTDTKLRDVDRSLPSLVVNHWLIRANLRRRSLALLHVMVSLWPWKDDNSAASFESKLSALSTKISREQAWKDRLSQRARRLKALWTLYTTFAYMLYALILVLVTGWQNWGAVEYTSLASIPLVIYAVRLALKTYYEYRISNIQRHLDSLHDQRHQTIEKLKAATKYNTTQQLLEKYGDSPPASPKPSTGTDAGKRNRTGGRSDVQATPPGGRTGIPPPPTANIPRVPPPEVTGSMIRQQQVTGRSPGQQDPPGFSIPDHRQTDPQEEFAPNAFGEEATTFAHRRAPAGQAAWYDRILDLLLGDSEADARNRFALICMHCKLVNGLAPPGTTSLEQLGKWRCSRCARWNGQENDAKALLASIGEQVRAERRVAGTDRLGHDDDDAHEARSGDRSDDENGKPAKENAAAVDEHE